MKTVKFALLISIAALPAVAVAQVQQLPAPFL